MATSNSTTIYIYALKDPDTDEIRYIGKSIRPKERLTNQCNEHSNTHRCHWIQSLVTQGKRPIQIILEALPEDCDWQKAERKWIAYGKEQGWKLTNGTEGGDGVSGLNPESKARMAQTWIGRKHKPESLLKIGAASKGRKFSEDALRKKSEKMKGRTFTPEHLSKIKAGREKLTPEQIRDIRLMLSQGITQNIIGEKYDVHKSTISNVKNRKSYYDVPD